MDDLELEWEIEDRSAEVSCDNGKLRWMLKVGKKILITGIVVSSAPFVLPPLFAISAVGMVCSVPYGILLASYTCSKMVMNRLLPMSSPAEWNEKQGEQSEMFKEDPMEEVGMRIKLVDLETDEFDEGNILQAEAYQKVNVENDRKGTEVESGYDEEDDEFMDEEEERPSQSFYIKVKDIERSDGKQPTEEESSGELLEDAVHGSCEQAFSYLGGLEGSKGKTDSEKRVETVNVGGIGKAEVEEQYYPGDESMSEQPIEEVHNILIEFEGDGKSIQREKRLHIKSVAIQLPQSTDLEEDKELVRETRGLLEKIRDEGKNDHTFGDKLTTANEHVGAGKGDEKGDNNTEELMGNSLVLMEGIAEYDNKSNVEQDYQMKRDKNDVIFSHDEKEPKEQAPDQLEDLSTISQQGSPSAVNTFGERSVSTRPNESDEILISAENSPYEASDESLYSEGKIKEHIEALRTIIGYKATPRETPAEELKSLYLFTGIEPPPLKDASDIVELNSKLRYLMSVVGVK